MSRTPNTMDLSTVEVLADHVEHVRRNQALLREELHALIIDLVEVRADLSSESLELTRNGWALDRCALLLRHAEESKLQARLPRDA